jgi:hypothetical protein
MQLLSARTYITSTMFCFLVTQNTTTHTMHIAPMDKKTVLGTLAVIGVGTCGYGLYNAGRKWVHAVNERQNLLSDKINILQKCQQESEKAEIGRIDFIQKFEQLSVLWNEKINTFDQYNAKLLAISERTAKDRVESIQKLEQLSEQWNERINKFDQYDAKFVGLDTQQQLLHAEIDTQLQNLVEQLTIESARASRFTEELSNFRKTQGAQGTLIKTLQKQAEKSSEAITPSQATFIVEGIKSLTLIDEKLQKAAEDSGDRIGNLEAHVADLNESISLVQAILQKLPAPTKLSLKGSRSSGRREKIQSKRTPILNNFVEDLAEQDERTEALSITSESSLTSMSSAPSEDPLEVSLKELAAGIDDETLDEFLDT